MKYTIMTLCQLYCKPVPATDTNLFYKPMQESCERIWKEFTNEKQKEFKCSS